MMESHADNTEVSGQSVFWALATLAVSAMTQPSFNGYLWSDDTFKESMWPHRSSPFICLLDAGIEISSLVRRTRDTPEHAEEQQGEERAKPTIATMRIVVFLLGALPQAIKLFSMRGILVTQTIAAAFIISMVVNLVCTLHSATPEEDIAKMALKRRNDLERRKGDRSARPVPFFHGVMVLLGWVPHLGSLLWIWYLISGHVHIALPATLVNSTTTIIGVSITLSIIIGIAFGLWGKPSPLMKIPGVYLFVIVTLPALENLWRIDGRKERNARFAMSLFTTAGFCCFSLAYTVYVCARVLIGKPGKMDGQPVLPLSSHDTATAESGRRTSIQLRDFAQQAALAAVQPDDTALGATRDAASQTSVANPDTPSSPSQQVPTSPGEANDSQTPPKEDSKNLPWYLMPLVGILLIYFVLYTLAYGWPGDLNSEPEPEPEPESTAGDLPANDTPQPARRSSMRKLVLEYPVKGLSWICYSIASVFIRAFVGLISPMMRSFFWVQNSLFHHSDDTTWVAFGMLNFVTAAIYYLVVFDGAGTSNPQWTSVLG